MDSIQYTQRLLSLGVGVLFEADNINTLMPDAELRLTIMSSIAQDEVRKISERVKFGFKRAVEKGVVLGSNRIWGYEKDAGKLIVVEEEAAMIRLIFNWYANENMGMRGICKMLSEQEYQNNNGRDFSCSTLKGILTNPKYKGFYCGNKTHKTDYKLSDIKYLDAAEWVVYKDETGEIVPEIVSEELWERANDILKKRSQTQRAEDVSVYANRYPYSGKVFCAEHRQPYYRANYRYSSGDKEVWQCKLYTEKGKKGCTSPAVYTAELDEMMRQIMCFVLHDKDDITCALLKLYEKADATSDGKEKTAKCRKIIGDCCKAKDKLLDLSIKGKLSDDEFEQRNEQMNLKIEEMKKQITALTQAEKENDAARCTAQTLQKHIENELNFTSGFGTALIDALLCRVEVLPKTAQNEVLLRVSLHGMDDVLSFRLTRHRGKDTSVRYIPYICSGQI
ncbi:MAG: recombinase family protein [Ruthenibacterium sp.]